MMEESRFWRPPVVKKSSAPPLNIRAAQRGSAARHSRYLAEAALSGKGGRSLPLPRTRSTATTVGQNGRKVDIGRI